MAITDKTAALAASASDNDEALVALIVSGDLAAFEQLMRRDNAALFRAARAIVRDDADAEDALKEAHLAACRHLGEFRAESRLLRATRPCRARPTSNEVAPARGQSTGGRSLRRTSGSTGFRR